ncbi:MAG: hypothetical protein K0R08_117 [Solimicrobium sp.]|nr:hypothetical protein [Solimicrobium sp.]
MSQKDTDSYIKEIAVAVAQQQGIQFKSLKEANDHTEKTTQEILHLLQQSNTILQEGLQILSEKSTGFVADFSKKLLDQLQSPGPFTKIVAEDLQQNEQALKLFSEAVNSFYDCGDYHIEQCVLSVFMMLFPLYPQPYACYATMIWRKEGINAAETLYSQLVAAMEDPVLDYFAADCFVKAGNQIKAKELVQRALEKLQTLPEQQELREHLLQILARCE